MYVIVPNFVVIGKNCCGDHDFSFQMAVVRHIGFVGHVYWTTHVE